MRSTNDQLQKYFILSPKLSLIIFLLLMLGACVAPAPSSDDGSASNPSQSRETAPTVEPPVEIALVTFVEGTISIEEPTAQRRVPGLMALARQSGNTPSAFQVLRSGTVLRIEAGGRITIVCYSDKVYSVAGPRSVTLTAETCDEGEPIPATPRRDSGGIDTARGSSRVEGESREDESDYGTKPVIISPRHTSLYTRTPKLAWVSVQGTIEYELSISSLDPFDTIYLDAEDVTCVEDKRGESNTLCSAPWPEEWSLSHDQRYFLDIGARTGIASPLREAVSSGLSTISTEEAEDIAANVEKILSLSLDPVTENLLLAVLYSKHELYSEAILAYEQVVALQPAVPIYVTLGDLYRQVDLQRWAFYAYEEALDLMDDQGQDDMESRAAAEMGLGLVYYSRQNYELAKEHFERARPLYVALGGEDALADLDFNLVEAVERLP